MTTPPDHAAVPVLSFAPGAGLLPIDLTEMYRANTFIQGATRAGKSWMLRFLMEQLFGRVQQMVFDTEGEYASLTEKFDYALFSLETPVQALPANAPLLIRRLLDMGTSAIFDLSDLSTTDQQEFVRLAAGELLRLTTNNPPPASCSCSTKCSASPPTAARARRPARRRCASWRTEASSAACSCWRPPSAIPASTPPCAAP